MFPSFFSETKQAVTGITESIRAHQKQKNRYPNSTEE